MVNTQEIRLKYKIPGTLSTLFFIKIEIAGKRMLIKM